ncbi:MAG: hypothetical protein AB4368_03970 [Xenococcaceae cyanobacterium]
MTSVTRFEFPLAKAEYLLPIEQHLGLGAISQIGSGMKWDYLQQK